MSDINNIYNLKLEYKHVENSQTVWDPNGVEGCDEETFLRNNKGVDKSIFSVLDINKDGYITQQEYNLACGMDKNKDGVVTEKERSESCMTQMKFFARRGIDKWFKIDKNRDGLGSNVEWKSWDTYNENSKSLEGVMSNEELAKKYNLKEEIIDDMQGWLDGEIEQLKADAKNMYGVELSEKQIIELKKEQMKQLNTWLFKEGDNANSSFYQQLSQDVYTRLITEEEQVSCCGGNIDKPPMASQPIRNKDGKIEATGCKQIFKTIGLEYKVKDEKTGEEIIKRTTNTPEEMKNRLCWAMFNTKTQEEQADMLPEEYAAHQAEWNKIRNMTADDFRELLKPENEEKLKEFESNSLMSLNQIVRYIDIVESTTGKPWDSDNWEVNQEQWNEICEKVNGTYGDDTRLEGKTRADIPENRQALLRFLEEKGWLYEQFK